MGYSKEDDKTIKKIGTIVLSEQPIQKVHLELKKYKKGPIKLAIVFENESLYGKDSGKTYFSAKMPRLGWEEVKKLNEKLPKMLEKAYKLMDDLS